MLINQTAADRYWPGKDPIGTQALVFGALNQWATIVGVVGDVKQLGKEQASPPTAYFPFQQGPQIELCGRKESPKR